MLKQTGLQRKVDELGRIVIPRDLRKMANLTEGTMIAFLYDNDTKMIAMATPPKFSDETEQLLTLLKDVVTFPFAAQVNNTPWTGSVLVPNPQQTYHLQNSRNEEIDITVCAEDVKTNKPNFVMMCKMLNH